MKAIILAAGRGSRMKSLTDERPKCLVEFRGKPLLQWQLEALRGAGVSEIGVVCGYRGELLMPYGLKMFDNPRWAETNMVSSLACAESWLTQEPCLVSYSDIFFKTDAVLALLDCKSDIAITYDPNWLELWQRRFVNPLEDAETFRIDANRRILEIGRKPKTVNEVQGQYMGLLKFTPTAWAAIEVLRAKMKPELRDRIDMTSTLNCIVETGFPIAGVPVVSPWGEIDSDEDIVRQGGANVASTSPTSS